MKRFLVVISILLALASCSQDRDEMRERLDYVSQCNRADTVFTEAWLPTVDSLVRFFDLHGNANERMMAHYLQGCVHHDMGEAPIALECYQKATEMADTTRRDCDLRTLYSVYGQMALLFHMQFLPDDEMEALRNSERIAWKEKDVFNALRAFELRIRPFFLKGDTDSVLSVTSQARQLYLKYGYRKHAAWVCNTAIYLLTERHMMDEAGKLISIYEKESGVYDKKGNVAKGRETYYVIKGNYLLSCGKVDSALVYFQNALEHGLMEGAYKGILAVYEKRHDPDSIAKYAKLFATSNDSSYLHVNQERIHQISAFYNFNRHQRNAEQEAVALEKSKRMLAYLVTLAIAFVSILILYHLQKKRIAAKRTTALMGEIVNLQFEIQKYKADKESIIVEYSSLLDAKRQEGDKLLKRIEFYKREKDERECEHQEYIQKLADIQAEILHTTEAYEDLLNGKDATIRILEEEVGKLTRQLRKDSNINDRQIFYDSQVYQRINGLRQFTKGYKPPTEDDWSGLLSLFRKCFSRFFLFVTNGKRLTKDQLRVCVLLRLDFSESEMMLLMGKRHKQSITNAKSQANEKLFGIRDAKTLKENLFPYF
ncbi:MAG: hypothetical protein IJK87_01740 [Prevotella sp.]|nr:hypothetical protein [Prevotella sp.]